MTALIDFDGIKVAALACARSLLPELVPGGQFKGDEYIALNSSRADNSLGSFKINFKIGKWSDFATGAKGGDVISWYAHAYGLNQGEAARRIAENLNVTALKTNGSKALPKIYSYGEEGPPIGRNEIRRHYYPKRGEPKNKVKIKKGDDGWTTCYRVLQDGKPVGWQYGKPLGFRATSYFGEVSGKPPEMPPSPSRRACRQAEGHGPASLPTSRVHGHRAQPSCDPPVAESLRGRPPHRVPEWHLG